MFITKLTKKALQDIMKAASARAEGFEPTGNLMVMGDFVVKIEEGLSLKDFNKSLALHLGEMVKMAKQKGATEYVFIPTYLIGPDMSEMLVIKLLVPQSRIVPASSTQIPLQGPEGQGAGNKILHLKP